jgi:hypothetical protein
MMIRENKNKPQYNIELKKKYDYLPSRNQYKQQSKIEIIIYLVKKLKFL